MKMPETKAANSSEKNDLERIGLFSEMSYLSGKGYTPNTIDVFNKAVMKEPQMSCGYPKSRTATQDGYFTDTFNRIFIAEGLNQPLKLFLRQQLEAKKKNIVDAPFKPSNYSKKSACPGDYFGTFAGKIEAVNPATKPFTRQKEKPNMFSKPGKKGGPGYVDITIGKYPSHSDDKYYEPNIIAKNTYEMHKKGIRAGNFVSTVCPRPYFGPNPYLMGKVVGGLKTSTPAKQIITPFKPSSPAKLPGGCMAGCFSEYPKQIFVKVKEKKTPKIPYISKEFLPQIREKSYRIRSVANYNVDISVNVDNYKNYNPVLYPLSEGR